MIKRIQYGSIQLCFWALLLLALGVSGFRFALSELNLFKTEIESQLSLYLGTQVNIAKIRGVLNGFKPELALHDIKIQSQHHKETALQLQKIHLGLDLLSSIEGPLLESLQVTIMGAKLSIKRLKSGSIAIQGLPNIENTQNPSWLMQGQQYKLIDSEINWHDEKRNALAVQLEHVNISIYNKDLQHKIFITMDLPETLGESLNLAMNFTGDMFSPDSINARLFVQGKDIKLAKFITGDLPFDFSITKGHGDFSAWSTWKASQMTQMSGNILMSDAEIKGKQNNLFPIDQLELQFKLQKQQQQWQLALKDAHLSSQKVDLDIPRLSVALEHNKNGDLTHIALNCPSLDLGSLNKIITKNRVLAEDTHRHIQSLAIEGQVKDLLFLANPLEQTFSINGQLNQLHTKATDELPGIEGISLFIKGTEQQGDIYLNSQQLTYNAPSQLREPLHLTHALGEIHWQQQVDNWLFSSPMLELNTTELKTKNKFQFSFPKNDQPASLTLQSAFYGHDAAQIPHYLTTDIVKQKALLEWLDHAFLSGDADHGGLLFRGALNNYPFTDSSGVFEVLFNAKNVDLHYADDWPLVENLAAEIRFFSESLEVNIHQGLANQTTIEGATIKLDSFDSSRTLSIKGDVSGDLTQAIDFLKQTPYKEQITTVNKLLDMQGLFSAAIDLEVPMIDELPAKINITVVPQSAQLHIAAADLQIADINGKLHITENDIVSENLTANILGYPVETNIDCNAQNTRVLLSGQTDIKQLAQQFSSQLWTSLTGIANYQVRLNIPNDTNKNTKLQFITDLDGIAIDFPPLSKAKNQANPFSLDLSMDTSGINSLNINYENRLIPENSLNINLKKILPHWQGLIHSPFASGSIFIPIPFNKNSEISLFCDKVNLSAFDNMNLKSGTPSFSVHDFPSFKLESRALYWKNYNLGKLKLLTQPVSDGLLIKQLNITSATNELELSGHWLQTKASNKTLISGNLLSENFGHLLQQLQLSENLIDSTADIQFSINWPGAPNEISRQTITGTVLSHLTNGRILSVEPGLGRVLGALDIWKLFKRLRFDFSDITKKGLSFSEITADTSISQGLASTKKFYINAMPAEIYITGTTHLGTREVDLLATVLPKFPIAGTIIGSVANAVTKTFIGEQHVGGLILSLLYEIKGTWEQFTVNRQFSPALTRQTLIPRNNNTSATNLLKPK